MATSKQIVANRRNALRSHRPSDALRAKSTSALDSGSTGCLSERVLLPDEDHLEFEHLLGEFARARLRPRGAARIGPGRADRIQSVAASPRCTCRSWNLPHGILSGARS